MTLLAPLVTGIGGSLLKGLGSGKQAETTSTQSGSKTSSSSGTTDQFNDTIEDPQFAAFRQALLPMMLGLMEKSQQPVYTDAKIASTLADINRQFSKEDVNPAMAGRGLLGSGFNQQVRQDIDNQRASTASNFFTQLPFLENQAQMTNMQNALGLGAGFAGRAPVDQRLTGNTSQTGTETFNSKGTQTQEGPGFLGGFANGLGGFMGSGLGQKTIGKLFGLGGGF